jgi:hypothetical protein
MNRKRSPLLTAFKTVCRESIEGCKTYADILKAAREFAEKANRHADKADSLDWCIHSAVLTFYNRPQKTLADREDFLHTLDDFFDFVITFPEKYFFKCACLVEWAKKLQELRLTSTNKAISELVGLLQTVTDDLAVHSIYVRIHNLIILLPESPEVSPLKHVWPALKKSMLEYDFTVFKDTLELIQEDVSEYEELKGDFSKFLLDLRLRMVEREALYLESQIRRLKNAKGLEEILAIWKDADVIMPSIHPQLRFIPITAAWQYIEPILRLLILQPHPVEQMLDVEVQYEELVALLRPSMITHIPTFEAVCHELRLGLVTQHFLTPKYKGVNLVAF